MSDDAGRELRRFRGFMNRDEAIPPSSSPLLSEGAPEPLPPERQEDNSAQGVWDLLMISDLIYGALVLIIGAIIALSR